MAGSIDAQGLKIQGRGYLKFLSNRLGVGSRLSGKIARLPPYFGVYCIFINTFIENLTGVVVLFYTHSSTMCIYDHSCNNVVDVVRNVSLLTSWLVTKISLGLFVLRRDGFY